MLVLTRKVGEGIAIGDDVKIIVMQIKGKQVRLGIKASAKTAVHREEIFQKIQDENLRASDPDAGALDDAADRLRASNQEVEGRSVPFRRMVRSEKP